MFGLQDYGILMLLISFFLVPSQASYLPVHPLVPGKRHFSAAWLRKVVPTCFAVMWAPSQGGHKPS